MRSAAAYYAAEPFYLHRDLFQRAFLHFVELLGCAHDEHVQRRFHDTLHGALVEALELKPDCLTTLAGLRKRGLYLSIVSNIDDDMLTPLVRREGLHKYFDHCMSSEAARSCKPDRRFFELALQKSALAANEVLFVGDSPEHDIDGATAVGMRTALIIEPGVEPPMQSGRASPPADHTIFNLSELASIVS